VKHERKINLPPLEEYSRRLETLNLDAALEDAYEKGNMLEVLDIVRSVAEADQVPDKADSGKPVRRTWIARAVTSRTTAKGEAARLATPPHSAPPKGAQFVLLLAPKEMRENLVGDLEEEFRTILLPQYGAPWARLWYRWQVAAALVPLIWAQARRVAGAMLLLKWIR
jgi:hypothetical protein